MGYRHLWDRPFWKISGSPRTTASNDFEAAIGVTKEMRLNASIDHRLSNMFSIRTDVVNHSYTYPLLKTELFLSHTCQMDVFVFHVVVQQIIFSKNSFCDIFTSSLDGFDHLSYIFISWRSNSMRTLN